MTSARTVPRVIRASNAGAAAGPTGAEKGRNGGRSRITIWIVSSVAEEVFCRGWFQTWAMGSRHEDARAMDLLPSAVLFGAMHLGILFAGVDVLSVALLVPMVTLLGWLAAWARARSGSLYPAIAGHVAFNVGGVVGGIVFRIVTGHLPG